MAEMRAGTLAVKTVFVKAVCWALSMVAQRAAWMADSRAVLKAALLAAQMVDPSVEPKVVPKAARWVVQTVFPWVVHADYHSVAPLVSE